MLNMRGNLNSMKEDLEVLNNIENADYLTQKKLLRKGLIRQLKDQVENIYITQKYIDNVLFNKNEFSEKYDHKKFSFLEKSKNYWYFTKEINQMIISFYKILEKHPDKISENGIYIDEDIFLLEDFSEYLEEVRKQFKKQKD